MRVTQAFQQLCSRGKVGNCQCKFTQWISLQNTKYFPRRNFSQAVFEESEFEAREGRRLGGQMRVQLPA